MTTNNQKIATKLADSLDIQEGTNDFLTFSLDNEQYGIPILSVQEIIGYQPATSMPNTPPWMAGLINIRGVVIPVLDLREKFSMAPGEYDDASVIIVTRVEDRIVGAVVDEVNDVLALTSEQIQPTPEMSGSIPPQLITGLGQQDDRMVMLLDIARLLAEAIEEPQAV